MKKRNMGWKKSGSIGNMEEGHNTWYIGRATKINTTSR